VKARTVILVAAGVIAIVAVRLHRSSPKNSELDLAPGEGARETTSVPGREAPAPSGRIDSVEVVAPDQMTTRTDPATAVEAKVPAEQAATPALEPRLEKVRLGSLHDRLDAIRSLPEQLPTETCDGLISLLLSPLPADVQGGGEFVVRNDIMAALVRQRSISPNTVAGLISLLERRGENEVLRDYALQHLSLIYEREDAVPLRSTLRPVLFAMLQEPTGTLAGTSLLALQRLIDTDPDLPADRLRAEALRLAAEPGIGAANRTAAYQVCGLMGIHEALPSMRRDAQLSACIPLQVAAIAGLGALGGGIDRQLLASIDTTSVSVLGVAVTAAARRLEVAGSTTANGVEQ
jgi:hypothetical protein